MVEIARYLVELAHCEDVLHLIDEIVALAPAPAGDLVDVRQPRRARTKGQAGRRGVVLVDDNDLGLVIEHATEPGGRQRPAGATAEDA